MRTPLLVSMVLVIRRTCLAKEAKLPFLLKVLGLTCLRLKVLREVVRLRLKDAMFFYCKTLTLIYYSTTTHSVMRRSIASLSKGLKLGPNQSAQKLLLVNTIIFGLSRGSRYVWIIPKLLFIRCILFSYRILSWAQMASLSVDDLMCYLSLV